jgi:signal transduction histidine kinase
MWSVKEGEIKVQEKQDTSSPQTWTRVLIVLGLTIFYVITFRSILNDIGPVGTALVALPVAAAGWYFEVNAGLMASLLGIILSTALLTVFAGKNWILWMTTVWPVNLMVILIGIISGYLSKFINEYKHIEVELRSRERFLTLINLTTIDFLNQEKNSDRYYFLMTHLANIFVSDYAYFVRWGEAQEQMLPVASTISLQEPSPRIVADSNKTSLAESVLQAGHILAVDDVLNSSYIVNSAQFNETSLPACSALGIPLIIKNLKLGAIIIAYNSPHIFTTTETNRAQQAGNQIAIALSLIQQEEKIQKRLKEANALANIGFALSETGRVGIETVFQLIADSTKDLIPGAEQVVLHSISDNKEILIPQAVSGFSQSEKGVLSLRINQSIAGQVLTSGEIIIISNAEMDPRFKNWEMPVKFRSLMVAPVQRGEEKLGSISVQSNVISAFTKEDSHLLSAMGIQAAIAIENARLLENTQQALNESNALYRINQGLVASLETDKLLQDTVDLLQKNFGYYHVQIYIAESGTGDIVLRAGSSEIGKKLKEAGHRLRSGDGIVGHVAETGEVFFTNDVDQVHFFVPNRFLPDTKSELAIPVKIDGYILGVLDIQQIPPRYFKERDIQLVSAVADQLAVALQKANLYEKLQISLEQEKTIRHQLVQNERLAVMGRLLASVSHELNNPLQAIQNALFLLKEEKAISTQGKQDLNIVLAESERMANLLEQLRATYRPIQTEDFRPTQINSIVEDVHTLVSPHLRHNQVNFEFHPDPDLPLILALSDQIRQVVLNLFMNAVEAMADGGKLTIDTKLSDNANEVLLIISDTGTGISPAIMPNIFEAFITDKQKGTGLGLTITYDIVIKHRGRITAQNNEDCGSTFKVWLPVKSKEVE